MVISGFYTDGKTAKRHEVEAYLWNDGLRFRTRERDVEADWDGKGLSLLEETYENQPARLTHRNEPDAVLTITNPVLFEELLAAYPHLLRRSFVAGSTGGRLVKWSVAVIAVLGFMVLGLPHFAARMARHVPDDWSAQLGKSVVESMTADSEVCSNGDGERVLSEFANRLLAARNIDTPVSIKIVRDERVNAFAAPGGHVVFFSGLIDAAQSGDEVAGVLAHELAHVVEDHAMRGLARSMALRFVIAAIVGDISGISAIIANLGGSAMISKNSRAMEAQADDIAVGLLNNLDYRASGLTDFFARLDEEGLNDIPDALVWLSSHPVNDARIAAVSAADQGREPAFTDDQWGAVKAYCLERASP